MTLAREKARRYVNGYTFGGAAYSIIPLPLATSLGLSVAEATMMGQIAKIYGLKIDAVIWPLLLKLLLVQFGGSVALKALAEGLNFVPVIGWLAKPMVASGVIKGIGEATIRFFESRFPNQKANSRPPWKDFLKLCNGIDINIEELREYWDNLPENSIEQVED